VAPPESALARMSIVQACWGSCPSACPTTGPGAGPALWA
jgi:hypothetical protein